MGWLDNEIGLKRCLSLGFGDFESSGLEKDIWVKHKLVWGRPWVVSGRQGGGLPQWSSVQ